MLPLADARAHVLAAVEALVPVSLPVRDAAGCVLAQAVTAAENVPPFANTAMDGYAVRAADVAGATDETPVVLPVVAEVAAGHPADRALAPGEAMRIFTGAPMPDGADAVVMVERTERIDGGRQVAIHEAVASGLHIRPAGDDVRAGQVVAEPGAWLSAGMLGVLASVGCTEVKAHPRPRVGVLATGDELVEGGAPLAPGQIRETNRVALVALVEASGWEAVDLGIARDDEAAITDAIECAADRCDALLTSGGVSMGDTDLVKVVLDRLAAMRWMQIAIRPAKPFAFGVVERDGRRIPVFGLPGNPVSSLVSFELLARPALRRMAGHPDARLDRPMVVATAPDGLERRPDGKLHLVRVAVESAPDGLAARSAGGQGSHQLTAMGRANGLALVPDGPGVEPGGQVQVLLVGEVPTSEGLALTR